MNYKGYYQSPTGIIEITADESAILSVKFVTQQSGYNDESQTIIAQCIARLQEYFAGNRKSFDLPLNPEGTPFQQKVWKALTEVPYGQTICYKELAIKIGQPGASRAVGNANGKNPICLLIPCHRVIRGNGTLGGYAYGTETKSFLLKLEKGK